MNRGTHASIIAVGIAFGFLVTGSGDGIEAYAIALLEEKH